MKIVMDMEANGLAPSKIWVIVCKDIDTNRHYVFRRPDLEPEPFIQFMADVKMIIGHNFLGYDIIHANRLIPGLSLDPKCVVDTLVVSKLLDFRRADGHSLEAYARGFGYEKVSILDWEEYDERMVERCIVDCDINHELFKEQERFIYSPKWRDALRTEHFVASLCTEMETTGFYFDIPKAEGILRDISQELQELEKTLQKEIPPRLSFLKEIIPRVTSKGTLGKAQFKWHPTGDLREFNGYPFSLLEYKPFNPGSHSQRMEFLWEAGWKPTEKSEGHKDFLRLPKPRDEEREKHFLKYGWKTSDENLKTLPPSAPPSAHLLVRYLLLRSRASKLEKEWLGNVNREDSRIHGRFNGIGTWTHRLSHDRPNLGNIPAYNAREPEKTPFSDVMRGCWSASPNSYLVGVDAEGIQLRVLAHYINDPEFTKALVTGKKEDGTDAHSVNQRALGPLCKSRDTAKTFIYAWILDAGVGRIAEVLDCSFEEAHQAGKNFLDRYPGLRYIKLEVVPEDAERGYFQGLDGRFVRVPFDNVGARRHYMVAGYLQNGEKVIMARSAQLWVPKLRKEKIPFRVVNWVHDEFQVETPRDLDVAKYVAETIANSFPQVSDELNLRCPMAGSFLSDHGVFPVDPGNPNGPKWAIGDNWYQTH